MELGSMFETLPIERYDIDFTEKRYPESYENYLQNNVELRTILAKRKFEMADFESSLGKMILSQKELVKSKSIFKRGRFQFTLTQCVVTYTLPMLLALEDETHPLSAVFIKVWKEVFGDSLTAASHESIAKSFNPNFMGMANPFKNN